MENIFPTVFQSEIDELLKKHYSSQIIHLSSRITKKLQVAIWGRSIIGSLDKLIMLLSVSH